MSNLDKETEEDDQLEDDSNLGTVTLLSRQRLRSFSPSRIHAAAKRVALTTKSARKKVRTSTVNIPGPSEGVLPPDALPVTAHEALHHLAKRVRRRREEEKEEEEEEEGERVRRGEEVEEEEEEG